MGRSTERGASSETEPAGPTRLARVSVPNVEVSHQGVNDYNRKECAYGAASKRGRSRFVVGTVGRDHREVKLPDPIRVCLCF